MAEVLYNMFLLANFRTGLNKLVTARKQIKQTLLYQSLHYPLRHSSISLFYQLPQQFSSVQLHTENDRRQSVYNMEIARSKGPNSEA